MLVNHPIKINIRWKAKISKRAAAQKEKIRRLCRELYLKYKTDKLLVYAILTSLGISRSHLTLSRFAINGDIVWQKSWFHTYGIYQKKLDICFGRTITRKKSSNS